MADVVDILGVPFAKLTLDGAVRLMGEVVGQGRSVPYHVITANPEIVMAALRDESLRRIIAEADLVTADGIGIVFASRWIGDPVPERVTGYDILMRLLADGDRNGWSFYFLGCDEETSRKATDVIAARFPGLRVAGRHHGYFGAEEEAEIVADIRSARPDVLVVAMGAPLAERWIYRRKTELPVKLAIGVGGSLDVIAGKVKRAPRLWQALNLEWLYRLLKQPSRWRRQLALPAFALRVLFGGRK
jgi:N-acetylglucosaminyldiphosphoundecaprenol N-acetyl-beta-D-mannosaminyltransferase